MTSGTTNRQRARRTALFTALALATTGLGIALAQAAGGLGGLPAPNEWFLSAAAWSAVIVGLTSFTRANLLKNLRGAAAVALPFGIGIAGALIASTGALAMVGINLDATIYEAVVFGIIAAGMAVGWYDGSTAVMEAGGKATARLQLAAAAAADPPPLAAQHFAGGNLTGGAKSQGVNPQALTDYLLQLVAAQFGQRLPPFIWGILETLAQEFAEQQLTEEVRAAIQRRLLDLLAAAGAPGRDT